MSTHELIVDYLVSDEFIRFYSIFQHLAIVCSFLTFGLLLFVILHASTTAMRTYKWFVLHEAIWNLVVDLFISTWQVVSLFPLGCGFSSSTWFRYTNSNVSQSFFQIIAFCCVGKLVAMMLTLAYRFSQIIPQGNVLLRLYNRLTPWAQVTSFIIGQIIVTPLFYTSAERRAEIRRELETSNIVINQIYKDEPTLICIASYGIPKTTLVIMLMVVPFACLLFFLAAITASWILRKQRHTLRPTTLKLQKMFFFASNMHVACACLLLGVPLFIILAAPYYPTHYTNNVVCLVVCVTSLHSIADCIILLYFIRPYRQYLRKFWTQCRGRQIPLNRYRTSFTDIWTTQKPRLSVVVPVAWQ